MQCRALFWVYKLANPAFPGCQARLSGLGMLRGCDLLALLTKSVGRLRRTAR